MRHLSILGVAVVLLLALCGAAPSNPVAQPLPPGPMAHLGTSAPAYWSPYADEQGQQPYATEVPAGVYPVIDRQVWGWDMILLPGDGRVWVEEWRLYGATVAFWRTISTDTLAYDTYDPNTRHLVPSVPPGEYPIIGQVYLAGVGIPEGQICCGHAEYWSQTETRDGRTVWMFDHY